MTSISKTPILEWKNCLNTLTDEDPCPICLESNSNKKTVLHNGAHQFHKFCIKTWFNISKQCPTCRKKIEEGDLKGRFSKVADRIEGYSLGVPGLVTGLLSAGVAGALAVVGANATGLVGAAVVGGAVAGLVVKETLVELGTARLVRAVIKAPKVIAVAGVLGTAAGLVGMATGVVANQIGLGAPRQG